MQEKIQSGRVQLQKVSTKDNLAGIMTKYVNADALWKNMMRMGFGARGGRHDLNPTTG